MTAIDVGHEVYSRTRAHLDSVSSPVGGIVIARCSAVNEETDEVEDGYVVVDTWHGQLTFDVLPDSDVDAGSARPASDRLVTDLARRLARDIANRRTPAERAGRLTAREIRAANAIRALHDALIERHGPAHYRLDTPRPAKPSEPRPTMPPNRSLLCD